jgi:hypothetical protein
MTKVKTTRVPPRARPTRAPTQDTSLRPFSYRASNEELEELRRRILATRWPEEELVDDQSQGVQLATTAVRGSFR